jgi:predicted nucleic acid-binding protein
VNSCKYEIVISDIVLKEIKRITRLSDYDINDFPSPFSHKLTIVKVDESLIKSASELNKKWNVGLFDCIHYLISQNYDCIVTWNIKHFPNGRKPSEM